MAVFDDIVTSPSLPSPQSDPTAIAFISTALSSIDVTADPFVTALPINKESVGVVPLVLLVKLHDSASLLESLANVT